LKYALVTFGCRVNQADSLALEAQLREKGATQAAPEDADVVVVNSCSVTATADQGTRQAIRRIVRANPDVRVVVTGCYATREPDDVRALPNVLHVVANDDKERLVALLDDGDGPCGHPVGPGLGGRTVLTLRVQTGCEEACSYCIIPRTRGAGRSRPLPSVIDDLRRAVAAGYKEVVITGVHLGSYGRDLADRTSLNALVRALAEWPDDVLFRISSLEPMDCSGEIVDLVASSPRLAPHFHLPLQHGSDDMLRAMRRPYTVSYYQGLVDRIRTSMPDASIGSDIIVGFPGETDTQFAQMRAVLGQLPLTHLHVFPYSDRPGTEASRLQPKTDGRDTRERGRQVRAISEQMTRRFRESQAGKTRRALSVDDGWSAVTDNYIKVRLAEQRRRNEWIDVTV
jgi:threonylcarbamoyladenosine tRNA methylthiotransferase MtaB